MNIIDTHCHLFFEDFKDDLDEVLARAKERGVTKFIVPATAKENFQDVINLVEKYDDVYGSIGVHPYDAHETEEETYKEIEKLLDHPKIVAVGETGLDYHREGSEIEMQKNNFQWHLEMAKEKDLPIIVHCRSAKDDIFEMLDKYKPRGVVHCFSEDLDYAKKLFSIGFHISFTGIMTYEKSLSIQQVVKEGDIHRMMVETDSPYLKPGRKRSDQRCEPGDTREIAEKMAELKHISLEEVADITTNTATNLFKLP